MERDQLIDLTRRAVKLARDKTTDLAPAEHTVQASEYTSIERHERDVAMLMAKPAAGRLCLRAAGAWGATARSPCWGDPFS